MIFFDYLFRIQALLSIGTVIILVSVYFYRKAKHHSKPLRDALKQVWLTLFIR